MKREIPEKVFKKLEIDDLEIKTIDEKKRIIEHKITKEVEDRMGDIVRIDGIDLKKFKRKPGVLADHNYWGGNPPPIIAEGIGFRREGNALYARTKFFDPDNEEMSQGLRDLSKDHFALQKMKLLGWSIGFIPKKTEPRQDKDGKFLGYDFKESELLEYSSVVIPANQEAITDAFQKGLITKDLADKWPRKDLLPGEMAEKILTDEDIGKTAEEISRTTSGLLSGLLNPIGDDSTSSFTFKSAEEEIEEITEKLETEKQGMSPENIKALIEAIDRLLKKIEQRNKLKKILENLKRR